CSVWIDGSALGEELMNTFAPRILGAGIVIAQDQLLFFRLLYVLQSADLRGGFVGDCPAERNEMIRHARDGLLFVQCRTVFNGASEPLRGFHKPGSEITFVDAALQRLALQDDHHLKYRVDRRAATGSQRGHYFFKWHILMLAG